MTKAKDDLEAVRLMVEALDGFSDEERERIIRWTREKLGMRTIPEAGHRSSPGISDAVEPVPTHRQHSDGKSKDLKTFLAEKDPRSERHLSAVVAYYHRFVAPEGQRRDYITAEDLTNACRLADRSRPANPGQTLVNAFHAGLLDRGERGQYRLNSVGENLVAMVLPGGEETERATKKGKGNKPKKQRGTSSRTRRPKPRPSAKRGSRRRK
jgi:hypothetical protein